MTIVEKQGYCTLCRSTCGAIYGVERDRIVSIRPDPAHPTGQAMCLKGKAVAEMIDHPDRLLYPMRRTQPKGSADPGWVRITWEEALSETAARLGAIRAESGAEAVAFAMTTPAGTPMADSLEWVQRFVRVFGSPNSLYATELCNWHKDYAHAFTFGCGTPNADYANADLMILWGHNPTSVWLSQATRVGDGARRGARLLVIDPRETPLARQADVWLRVRPGSDCVVALGLTRLLLRNGQYDLPFIRGWSNGPLLVRGDNGRWLREQDLAPDAVSNRFMAWDRRTQAPVPCEIGEGEHASAGSEFALRGRFSVQTASGSIVDCAPAFELFFAAADEYTEERVEALAWVPAEQLRRAAQLIGESSRVAYHAWTGVGQHMNATQTERAIATLYALTGSFDEIGGNVVHARPPVNPVNTIDLLAQQQRAKALGLDRRPIGPPSDGWITTRDFYRAAVHGKPYRVRALCAFGSNFLVTQPDTELGAQALESLDFHVHCDLYVTPTSQNADILLPVNTPWEREALRVGFGVSAQAEGWVQLRQPMVPSKGETRSDNDIVFDLAVRLGMGDRFFGGDLEAGWNHILSPLGLTVADLRRNRGGLRYALPEVARKYRQPDATGKARGFRTETGRVELYSEKLLRHGYPPVPTFVDSNDAPAGADGPTDLPYVLTSVKNGYFCHAEHRNIPSLRKKSPLPRVAMHAELASALDIEDGDWVRLNTRYGAARFVAEINASQDARVLIAEYGWWQACPELGLPGFPAMGRETSNFNAMVRADSVDPVSGSISLRSLACNVERDASVDRRRRRWKGMRDFTVVACELATDDVMSVTFEAADEGLLPDYLPGQHITIRVDTHPIHGQLTRAYSLTGPAAVHDRRRYSISVRRARAIADDGAQVQGAMSSFIHDSLCVGQRVALGPPGGQFVIPVSTRQPVVLIAGGIGITPFLSYLETLTRCKTQPEVWLHYANRNPHAHAFRERLAELETQLGSLKIVNYYGDGSGGAPQRVDAANIDQQLIDERARFYMCGPDPMMTGFARGLVERGVPAHDIFKEAFRSPSTPTIAAGQVFDVKFAASGRDLKWRSEDGTLLAFGEREGVGLPSGCRVGQCESCAVRIVSGTVAWLNDSDIDDPNVCLACQCVPASDLVLDA